MASFGEPVAQNVNVNPMQGIQTISGLLGIKQQAQTLETGKAIQASARAEATTRGIAAQGQSEAADFLRSFDFPKHMGPDGTLDLDSAYQDPKFQNAGPGKELIANTLLGIKNNQIKNKQDMATLDNSVITGGSKLLGALVDDPDVKSGSPKGLEKINAQIDLIREMYPDQGRAFVDKFAQGINGDFVKPQDRSAALYHFQQQANDVSAQQQVQLPNIGSTYDANGNLIGTSQSRTTGALSAPQQPGIRPGLGPTQTPAYQAAVSRAGTTGAGTGNIDVDRANLISGSQQSATATIRLTQRIDQLSHEVANSLIANKMTQGLHAMGFPSIAAARTELQKDLGLVKGPLAARAGSDSRAAELLEGYPTDTTPENTTHSAMDYIRGTLRQTVARGQLLKKHGVEGIAAADDELTRGTDPLMHEAASLKPGQSNGFYKRNFKSPQEAQAFKSRVDAIKKHTNFLGSDNE